MSAESVAKKLIEKANKSNKTSLDRLNTVEQDIVRIANFVNNDIADRDAKNVYVVEVVEALIEAVGKDKVDAIVKANREKRDTEACDKKKAAVAKLVENKVIAPVLSISENSLIVGRETIGGNVVRPGRFNLELKGFTEDTQKRLLGKVTGESVETVNGAIIEVQEIYEYVEVATSGLSYPAPESTSTSEPEKG